MTESSESPSTGDPGLLANPEDGNIIDVVGEPVSRKQAIDLGYASKPTGIRRPPPEKKGGTAALALLVIICIAAVGVALLAAISPEWYNNVAAIVIGDKENPAQAEPVPVPSPPPEPEQPEQPAPNPEQPVATEQNIPAPTVRKSGQWPDAPDSPLFCAATVRENQSCIAMTAGYYTSGNLVVLDNESGNIIANAGLAGRPAGLGWLSDGREQVMCIPDFRRSKLRFFKFENDALLELPLTADLPGRPVQAAFVTDEGLCAVVCRTQSGLIVTLVRYVQPSSVQAIDTWSVSGDFSHSVLLLAGRGRSEAPVPVLFASSGDALLCLPGGELAAISPPPLSAPRLIAATMNCERQITCAFESDQNTALYSLDFSRQPVWAVLENNQVENILALVADGNSMLQLGITEAQLLDTIVALPAPPRIPAVTTAIELGEFFFIDTDGIVWGIGLIDRPGWTGEPDSESFSHAVMRQKAHTAFNNNGWTPNRLAGVDLPILMAILWHAAAMPDQVKALPVYKAAFNSFYPEARREAADLVLASDLDQRAELLQEQIFIETEENNIRHIAGNIGELPEKQAVPALLHIVLSENVSAVARSAAADQLRLFSGACLPDDAKCWRAWMEEQEKGKR